MTRRCPTLPIPEPQRFCRAGTNSHSLRRTVGILVLSLSASLATIPASAQSTGLASPIATSEIQGTMLVVTPSIACQAASLRVSGPEGYEAATSSQGESLLLDLEADAFLSHADLDASTPALPDGRYSYEVELLLVDGTRRTEQGSFFVEDGVAHPETDRQGDQPAIPGGPSAGDATGRERPILPAASNINDRISIADNAGDGITNLELYSDDGPSYSSALAIRNEHGTLHFENRDTTPVQFNPLMSLRTITTNRGYFGIGTTFPLAPLHVKDSAAAIRIQDSGFCTIPFNHSLPSAWEIQEDSGKLMFERVQNCAGDPDYGGKMWIAGDGKVGIGTSTPQTLLHVMSSDENRLRLQAGSGFRDLVTLPDGGFEIQGDGGGSERVIRIFPNAPDTSLALRPLGVGIGTANPQARLHVAGSAILEGDVAMGSSRTIKHEIKPLDDSEVLAAVRELPLYHWKYRKDPSQATHVGPMAEDVHDRFGLGRDGKHLSPTDSAGLALAAVQGVDARVEREFGELRARLKALASANHALALQNASLQDRVTDLETSLARKRLGTAGDGSSGSP